MKPPAFDKKGYINLENFILLHESIVSFLQEEYKGKVDVVPFQEKVALRANPNFEVTKLDSWVYTNTNVPKFDSGTHIGQPMPSIKSIYEQSSGIQSFKVFMGRAKSFGFHSTIGELKRHFDKSNEPVEKNRFNLYGLFLILHPELSDPAELKEKNYWAPTLEEAKMKTVKIAETNKVFRRFIGFYMSLYHAKVKWLLFSVTDTASPKVFDVQEKWFDDLEDEPEPTYSGHGTISKGEFFYMGQLASNDAPNYINIVCSSKAIFQNDKSYCFRATGQAVSRLKNNTTKHPDNRLLAFELLCLPIQETQYKKLEENRIAKISEIAQLDPLKSTYDDDALNRIALYLTFQRRMFAAKSPIKENIKKLSARGNQIQEHISLHGCYRILQFGYKVASVNDKNDSGKSSFSIIQSILRIEPSGDANLMTLVNDNSIEDELSKKTFKCALNPSGKPIKKKICVYAYHEDSFQICNFAILDFSQKKPCFKGLFSSVGWDEKGVIGGYIVFKKEKDSEVAKNLKEEILLPDKNGTYFDGDKELNSMIEALKDMWRKKAGSLMKHLNETNSIEAKNITNQNQPSNDDSIYTIGL